jgi:hypothetical protein
MYSSVHWVWLGDFEASVETQDALFVLKVEGTADLTKCKS